MYFVFLPGQPRRLRQRGHELQHEQVLRLPHATAGRTARTPRRTTSSGPTSRSTAVSTRPAAAGTRTSRATTRPTRRSAPWSTSTMEAITDPRGNAWQDSTGGAGENGDKCNRNMGVANASSTTVEQLPRRGLRRLLPHPARVVERSGARGARRERLRGELHDHGIARGGAATRPAATSPRRSPRRRSPATTATRSTTTSRSTTRRNQDDAFSVCRQPHRTPHGVSGAGSTGLGDSRAARDRERQPARRSVTGGPLLDGTVLTVDVHVRASTTRPGTAAPTIDAHRRRRPS